MGTKNLRILRTGEKKPNLEIRYLKQQISSNKRKIEIKMMTDDEDFGGSYEGSAIFDPKFPDYDEIRFLPANTVPPMTMRFPMNPTDQWENSGDLDELEIDAEGISTRRIDLAEKNGRETEDQIETVFFGLGGALIFIIIALIAVMIIRRRRAKFQKNLYSPGSKA